jgi:hypothetical protein
MFMMESITSELGKGKAYTKAQILSLVQLEEKILRIFPYDPSNSTSSDVLEVAIERQ